jgi:murein DD-endopeptidase MepM/ murein hydrolase activator NlpD
MKKLKNKYNIMVFSSNGKSINFELPSAIVKAIFFLIFFIFASSIYFGVNYFKLYSTKSSLKNLKTENKLLKNQILTFNEQITNLKNKVNTINKLGTKLRIMARLELPEKLTEGLGGPSFDEIKNFISGNSYQDENIKKLHYVIDKLSFELREEEKNLKQLFEYYKKNNIKLSSTPSIWPANGWVSSPFGIRRDPFTGRRRFHEGIDITNRIGTPIIAPADGVVVFAGRNGGYGNVIYISHGFGITTRYGHLSKILVKVGQHVQRGDLIGKMGSTGRSTGPHLHYEVRVNNKPVNPINFILN